MCSSLPSSKEGTRSRAARYGLNPKTVAKRRKQASTTGAPVGPARPRSITLNEAEETIVVEFRRHPLLRLHDVIGCLRETIPSLSRSTLHCCLQRHGSCRLPKVEGDKPANKAFKSYPIDFFHIDTAEGKLYLFVAIDGTGKFALT